MAHYARLTRDELSLRLRNRLGDEGVFWLSAERISALNEGISIWQALTGALIDEFDIPVINGQHFYDVPRQILSLQRVSWNGTSELSLTSLSELDYGFPGWDGTISSPALWAPVGFNKLVIYPAGTSGFLHLEGIREAPLLRSAADFIDIGDEEMTRLIGYGHHVATFKEGTQEHESTKGFLNDLVIAASKANARIKSLNIYRSALGTDRLITERPMEDTPSIGGRSAENV